MTWPGCADGYKDTGQALSGSCRPERHGSSVHREKGNAATSRSVRSVSTKDATRVQPAHRQTAHALRHDWGMQGATAITVDVTVAVVVDVLSFTTTLSVAADAGIAVLPYRWADDGAAGFARDHDAVLAVGRLAAGPGQISLSPASIRAADPPPPPAGAALAERVDYRLLGVGMEYRDYIEASDRRLGEMLAAVAVREGSADEFWTVVVVTDHGHVDAGGHGGETDAERTAWIATCGPTIAPGLQPDGLEQADVAAQALAILGVNPTSPDFVGVPFDQRARQPA